MDLSALCRTVRESTTVQPAGAGTHAEVGGTPREGAVVRAPAGVTAHDPGDLTVTVGGGTPVRVLDAALAEHDQMCALDPADADATVGGIVAAGLSGHRRLRYGPVRDQVLEVRFVTADGVVVKGGGPTVKNVSGFDLPRLLVGSLGTLGVVARVTLRARPRPRRSVWATGSGPPSVLAGRLHRPACVAWDGSTTYVLLEGHDADVEAELAAGRLTPGGGPPPRPPGVHRGRISVRPARVRAVAEGLAGAGAPYLAEVGVGTIHVATDDPAVLAGARAVAEAQGGRLLREAGAPHLDPFGAPPPGVAVMRRIKAAFDPHGKLAPGRMPFVEAPAAAAARAVAGSGPTRR